MFESTLISPENHWMLWAILLVTAWFGFRLEKTKAGSYLSSMLIALLTTFVLSNLSIIPDSAPAYDVVWSYLVPLAIPLLLFNADLKKIIKEAGPLLIAFTAGAIGTIIGTIIAFYVIPLGAEGWKLAGIFASTYIGGSMNYVAAAEALQLNSPGLLAAGVAADNLIMALYFLVLFTLPSIGFLKKAFRVRNTELADEKTGQAISSETGDNPGLTDMTKALAISFVICSIGFLLEDVTGLGGSGILIITAIVVTAATLFPRQMQEIKGSSKMGTMLMQVFFAAIGASANIMTVLKYGAILFVFAALILSIHLLFILAAGKLFKLDLREIVIASNANMGGPTTAAAMAVARKWEYLVTPAILIGTLGYSIATFLGTALGYWLQ